MKCPNQTSNLFQFQVNLSMFMCILFFSSFVCISAYANVYFQTTIIKQNIKKKNFFLTVYIVKGPLREGRSIRSGASGLPYYCAPLVCTPLAAYSSDHHATTHIR